MKKLEKQAIGIVAQLFDLAEVPVEKRQEISDVAYDYVIEQLIIADVVGQSEQLVCDHNYVKVGKVDGVDTKVCIVCGNNEAN